MKKNQKNSNKSQAMGRRPARLSPAEQEYLLECCSTACEDDWDDLLSDIVEFALNVDLNKEEILSLEWNQVDLCRGTISVSRGGCMVIMFLDPVALRILDQRADEDLSNFVFSKEVGRRLETEFFDRAFQEAVKEAELEDVYFDDLRRTYIVRQYAFSVYSSMENADLSDDEICDVFGDPELHASWKKRKALLK